MKLWIVSMECAGIAEAGGVKNVTFSLAKEFCSLKNTVTLFIPVFKCTSWENIIDIKTDVLSSEISICGNTEKISYIQAKSKDGGFNIVFVNHSCFSEKEAVYTYTENEQNQNPEHKKGCGHSDTLFMDICFQKAVIEYGKLISKSSLPEIIHCQDASTSTIPAFLKYNKLYSKTKSVVTIHNAGPAYHHNFTSIGEAAWYTELPTELLEASTNRGTVEPFLLASEAGANISTVSEVYAQELLNPEKAEVTDGLAPIFYAKKIKITGITNGFDYDRYNPQNKNDSHLPFEFNPEKLELEGKIKCRKFFIQNIVNTENFDCEGIKKFGKLECSLNLEKEVFISYHGRITSQKGISVLTDAIPAIISNFPNVRFIIAGQGEPFLEANIISLTEKFPGKITFMNGYDKVVARLSTAVSDFIVLPSYFEPCGLEDFIAQSYGTIPVAHKTGGLNKIIDGTTGFLYENNTAEALIAKLSEVITLLSVKKSMMNKIIKAGALSVHKEYYWKNVIQKKYIPYFKEIIKKV